MAEHTPGPWSSYSDDPPEVHNPTIHVEAPDWGDVATLGGGPLEIRQANAYLIAAAPELLAALRGMLDAWVKLGNDSPSMPGFEKTIAEVARAAIAKAT